MRCNLCALLAVFAIVAAAVLMIFAEISQVANQTVPRQIRFVTVETTDFGVALGDVDSGADTSNLYGTGARDGDNSGLRQYYEYGLWKFCEGNSQGSTTDAYCSPYAWGKQFRPLDAILADAPTDLQGPINDAIPDSVFANQSYLGDFSRGAFYCFFVGCCLIFIAVITAFLAHRFAFLISSIAAFLAFLCIAVGAAIWTAIIERTKSINSTTVAGGTDLGITVSYGNALWICWGAAAACLLSVLPFLFACCFGRRREEEYIDKDQEF